MESSLMQCLRSIIRIIFTIMHIIFIGWPGLVIPVAVITSYALQIYMHRFCLSQQAEGTSGKLPFPSEMPKLFGFVAIILHYITIIAIIFWISIRSEVSFRSSPQFCFRAVVKQKWKKIRSHTLVVSLSEVLWDCVSEDCFICSIRSEVSFQSIIGQWNTRDFDIVAAL